ncbi:MAG: glycosyltransferase family 39 protein [Parcubacteria group bacterium]|jgi:Ca2+/Na+ antiporter
MKNKALGFIRQNRLPIIFLAIFLLGAFLRAYHFSDWLHFELDQSRDAKVIDLAIVEGPSNLPLLGPKAAGTFLRLGPAFYYFKYLSALVFGDTPAGVAMIVMLFGVLAIPIFYLFAKRYFGSKLSLGITFIFSVSLYLVMYSRFSWNPNPLPLFTLLTFYSLLRTVDKNEKRQGLWLMATALFLAIATQMHFLAFVAVPAITFLFLVYKRPRIKLKYWLGAVAIAVFLYVPAIINDIETGGDNIGQFLEVAQGKSGKSDHDLIEKSIKSYNENALGYATVIFGLEKRELPRVIFEKSKLFSSICDDGCKNELGGGIFALLFFTLGIILLIINIKKEKDPQKKDFLVLTSFWFFVVLGLYVPISYDISPRFFLLVAAIPFIFLGLMLKSLKSLMKNKKINMVIVSVVILAVAGYNLQKIKQRFWQLGNASGASFKVETDRILKEKTRVTLEQQEKIISYVLFTQKKNGFPVYLNSDPEYRRSFLFHLDQNNIPRDDFRNATNSGKVYEHGNYFLIYPTLSNWKKDLKKYSANFDLQNQKEFGTLTLFELKPKPEAINATEQDFAPKGKAKNQSGTPVRYKWEEIFNDSASDENATNN